MASDLLRKASAQWNGNLREGNGTISASSGALQNVPYTFATRFENAPGTNPEELLAAAHAACFSMAFANTMARANYKVNYVKSEATCFLTPQQAGGFKITRMHLVTRASVEGIDNAKFQELAETAKKTCPVSGALAALEITLEATRE